MYAKDMEIPQLTLDIDADYKDCEVHIVPNKLKRRLLAEKRFRNRERVGSFRVSLDENSINDRNGELYDDIEQIYVRDRSACKYYSLYGESDLQDINIYRLRAGGTPQLVIEVPEFRNYLMYNLLASQILSNLIPSAVHLVIESESSSVGNVPLSAIMDQLSTGTFQGVNGERHLGGITASMFNASVSEITTAVSFYVLDTHSKGTLYL